MLGVKFKLKELRGHKVVPVIYIIKQDIRVNVAYSRKLMDKKNQILFFKFFFQNFFLHFFPTGIAEPFSQYCINLTLSSFSLAQGEYGVSA